jgi:hypothetical protein
MKSLFETKTKAPDGSKLTTKLVLDRYKYIEEVVKLVKTEGKEKIDNLL